MLATGLFGKLNPINDCWISINGVQIIFKVLPEITDRKGGHYNDQPVIGRSYPIKTYAYSDNRVITMKTHFVTTEDGDQQVNMHYLRAIQSAVYPVDDDPSSPYLPPYICQIKCGNLLTDQNGGVLCATLIDYSVSFPTDVVWDDQSYIPYKFDVDLTWHVVFTSSQLPGAGLIFGG